MASPGQVQAKRMGNIYLEETAHTRTLEVDFCGKKVAVTTACSHELKEKKCEKLRTRLIDQYRVGLIDKVRYFFSLIKKHSFKTALNMASSLTFSDKIVDLCQKRRPAFDKADNEMKDVIRQQNILINPSVPSKYAHHNDVRDGLIQGLTTELKKPDGMWNETTPRQKELMAGYLSLLHKEKALLSKHEKIIREVGELMIILEASWEQIRDNLDVIPST